MLVHGKSIGQVEEVLREVVPVLVLEASVPCPVVHFPVPRTTKNNLGTEQDLLLVVPGTDAGWRRGAICKRYRSFNHKSQNKIRVKKSSRN